MTGHAAGVTALAFDPAAKAGCSRRAATTAKSSCGISNSANLATTAFEDATGGINSVAFSPKGHVWPSPVSMGPSTSAKVRTGRLRKSARCAALAIASGGSRSVLTAACWPLAGGMG